MVILCVCILFFKQAVIQMSNLHKAPNRLASEKSPYLLQHASNPVDWWPWCDEAFEEARRKGKMVFLSIGYSTCHWCHVMARESFEDEEVADLLNAASIPIKLDREERPDIDHIYMACCVSVNGSGGWPLTILMTSEGHPFYAGTYLTKGQLMSLIRRAEKMWNTDRASLEGAGKRLTAFLNQAGETGERAPDRAMILRAVRALKKSFDERDGGFGGPPRFPMPQNLLLLIDCARESGDGEALHMAKRQLTQMARGGIFDHLGGGFHRYATDRQWLIPHFEKMLYDNALILYAYAEGYAATKCEFFGDIARRTADYALAELQQSEGGFMSAQDADSKGGEGAYYVFTQEEVAREAGPAFAKRYGVSAEGNFEGKNILNLLHAPDFEEEDDGMRASRAALTRYRDQRAKPATDHKVLAAHNGLMIAGLSRAARLLGEGAYLTAARRAWDFVKTRLMGGDGRLFIRWADGETAGDGLLNDYAFMMWGLVELYRATLDTALLEDAGNLGRHMLSRFEAANGGGLYMGAQDAALISRPREFTDGAMPSGNAAAALALGELARYTGDEFWRKAAGRQMRAVSFAAYSQEEAHAFSLFAMSRQLAPTRELVAVCADEAAHRYALKRLSALDDPHLYALVKWPGNEEALSRTAPFTAAYPIPPALTRYYLCQNGTCREPVEDFEKLNLK